MTTGLTDEWIARFMPTFRALTAERLAELRALRATAAATAAGAAGACAARQIGGLAHKIAGTAGTLDLPQLDALAAKTEEICHEIATDPGRAGDKRRALDSLLDALDAELARIVAAGDTQVEDRRPDRRS